MTTIWNYIQRFGMAGTFLARRSVADCLRFADELQQACWHGRQAKPCVSGILPVIALWLARLISIITG
jgi:hypothetical protein